MNKTVTLLGLLAAIVGVVMTICIPKGNIIVAVPFMVGFIMMVMSGRNVITRKDFWGQLRNAIDGKSNPELSKIEFNIFVFAAFLSISSAITGLIFVVIRSNG